MSSSNKEKIACIDKKTLGITLLLIVNVLWVLSSELTRFLYVDEDFKRPFFTVYVKSCLLIVYMIRYLLFEAPDEDNYKVLVTDGYSDNESFEMSIESLNLEGFEEVTDDSDVESFFEGEGGRRSKRIRFSDKREIRRMPSSNAEDQRKARLPYRHPSLECQFYRFPRHIKYTVFFFAPIWLLCSFTYQAALAFTSVSSLNLVSSSSSVFILAFSICFPSANNKFTLYKCFLVAMNIGGIMIVTHYMPSLLGAFFAQVSAVAYAIYLFAYTHFEEQFGRMSINLLFGTIGLISIVIGTPMLNLIDRFGIESLYPLPDMTQFSSIIFSGLIGTIVADYLWMLAAGMCDSLTSSLSLTIGIPLSFIADTVIRNKTPTVNQLLASIPIILAFVGAAYSQKGTAKRVYLSRTRRNDRNHDDNEQLIDEDD